MGSSPCLTILVLTEDSAGGAHLTIEKLLKKTFGLLVQGVRTHDACIRFEPQSPSEHRAMHGNGWKNRRLKELVDLRRTIATKMLEDEGDVPGFVVFHFDGDRRWSERSTAENPALFEERIVLPVEQIVREKLVRQGREAELHRRLRRLVVLVPYYSIEAWLYQNFEGVRRHCCGKIEHTERLAQWQSNRALLDDVLQPKSELPCIVSRSYPDLASGFPADEVLDVGASYEAVVTRMLDAEDLLAALTRTTR